MTCSGVARLTRKRACQVVPILPNQNPDSTVSTTVLYTGLDLAGALLAERAKLDIDQPLQTNVTNLSILEVRRTGFRSLSDSE